MKPLRAYWMFVLLFCLPAFASETQEKNLPKFCELKDIKGIKDNSFVKNKHVNVDLKVIAPGISETAKFYRLPYGSTAADVLKVDYQVKNGVVCCRPDDIKSVNNLDTDFAQRRYWSVSINEDVDVSPTKTLLKDGDHVVWTYHEGDK